METIRFMARSIARILFRCFFLSPTIVGKEHFGKGMENPPTLLVTDLAHPADLVLLFGFLPQIPRIVLPEDWPGGHLGPWVASQLEAIRLSKFELDDNATHLIEHCLRSGKTVLFPLSVPSDANRERRERLASSALSIAKRCDARLLGVLARGTTNLPPESCWLPKYRRTILHVTPPCSDAKVITSRLDEIRSDLNLGTVPKIHVS